MKDGRLRSAAEVLGVLAVVLSVVFLALQVRQANQIARAEASRELLAMFNQFHDAAIADPAVTDILVALANPAPELTPHQAIQARHFVSRLFNAFNAVHDAYTEGLVPIGVYEDYATAVRGYLRDYPGIVPPLRVLIESMPRIRRSPVWAPLFQEVQSD
jgi:hypothetical protein